MLHDLDNVRLDKGPTRLAKLESASIVVIEGVQCTDALQTIIDLAAVLDDDRWEQAHECVLRRKLATVDEIDASLARMAASRTPGTARIRRVLDRRPRSVVPTGSLLETLAVQMARRIDGLPDPE